jgi:hypothetical protein
MIPSIAGLIVSASLALGGYFLGAPLIIGLFASMPFGSTAFATLTALGGSSPLIYTLFALGIIVAVALRRNVLREVGIVFTRFPVTWIVLFLTIYTIVSAMIFPRLFEGQTTAFIPIDGVPTELPLSPTSGNITQTAYFTLGALTFLAFSIILLREENLKLVRRGFFTFVAVNATLGILDLGAKLAGAGDLLLPIRTASYALLTEVEHAGFWRIAGGFAEASAFGGTSLMCLAFTYVYWRMGKSRVAFHLTIVLLALLLLSTSSTAYGGLAILSIAPLMSLTRSALQNRFTSDDLLLLGLGICALAIGVTVFLYDERLFDPVVNLVETTIFDKPLSASGIERAYWNEKSLQAFLDTNAVGIGMGSSRSSSWIISVLSQLGLIGALAMTSLVFVILRGMGGQKPTAATAEIFVFAAAVRAAIAAQLLAGSLAGSGADPGMLFFIALSVILACRRFAATGRAGSAYSEVNPRSDGGRSRRGAEPVSPLPLRPHRP